MSRIGVRPIPIPEKAQVTIAHGEVVVKGPRGELRRRLHPLIEVEQEGDLIRVKRRDESRKARALHGLFRVLIDNMVVGVTQGFQRKLLVNGVGYKVDLKGSTLVLNLGYSHPIEFPLPEGISAKVQGSKNAIEIVLEGADKELLGLVASKIRALRPPEPYKGKGVQYADEVIIRKAGKAAAK